MKKLVSCIIFLLLALLLFFKCNDILLSTSTNRYYMLDEYLDSVDESYDVQIFGSCHAYTSFNAKTFTEEQDISAFVLAYPSEIIPTTYVRMATQFRQDAPEVAVIDIWGINAYDTYIDKESLFNDYLLPNLESFPFSREKLEVVNEYEHLNIWDLTFPIVRYKDRMMDNSLEEVDFNYSFREAHQFQPKYIRTEMELRFANRGYKPYDVYYITDYPDLQAQVDSDELLPLEEDIQKYVDKIIELCDEYDVELIFYRAPYRSNERELMKVNYFRDYCEERSITFIDLEKELEWDYMADFADYEHLSEDGAAKATEYLTPYILEALNR